MAGAMRFAPAFPAPISFATLEADNRPARSVSWFCHGDGLQLHRPLDP